jgi:type IV pilus assembly protein PilN
MAKINLRPWREELRQERQKEYLTILGGVVIAAVAIWFFINGAFNSVISDQQNRNYYLESQGAGLDKKIGEIKELRDKKDQLLERMRLIQDLQGNRPVIVRVFDEMARVLPDELFIESIQAKGGTFTLKGRSASNIQISNMMRNFDQSPWFINPNLLGVNANEGGYSSFDMIIGSSRPASGGEK